MPVIESFCPLVCEDDHVSRKLSDEHYQRYPVHTSQSFSSVYLQRSYMGSYYFQFEAREPLRPIFPNGL